ncbi:restriction endonuclease subunit S [Acinetobacter schindleri]|uniref:Type I restriction endonuclease subunit S n=1 Tax=Acinetobacter schindleri TaxID=108981 RepID=A0AAE7BX69_9GAMM|nr:restriction endonuclease subunit S [Acinetobacter schindleri]QIC67617.1 type I restriction endonuclease subunit S [Acinetobacter schindleri]
MSLDNLPVEWMNVKISDVTVKGEQRKPNDSEEFIYVDIGSINRDLKKIESPQFLLGKDAPSRARKVIKRGDILVSLTRPNLNAVALVGENYDQQIASTGFEVISPMFVESKYLFSLVRTQNFINEISKQEQGALYPAAKSSDVQAYEFPLPPLAEQQEIVRQLDVMLAQVEQIKAHLDAIPAILKKFRQSVLADAVSGKLLEQDVNFTNYKLSEISEFQNGYAFKSNWFTKEGDHQVIKLGNIRDDFLYIENAPSFVEVEVANQFKKFKPNVGDLLISMTGTRFKQDYGYVCQVSEDANLLINQRVGRIIPNKTLVNSSYLLLCLRSDLFRQEFFKGETGGVNQGNVGSKHIEQIELNIPSLEYQNGIVDLTDTLFRSVEHIDASTQSAQKRVNLLTQSILAKAFSGELTAEWREQHQELITGINSAESLLAKIQAEREASKPVKKAKKVK